jgi:hypothetical protein
MNNFELERRLKDFPVRVTCADELPISIKQRSRTYVVNTDPCSLPGSHWTVFHFPLLGPPEFFDPMGERAKTYNSRFEYVLANNGPGYLYTRTKFNRKTRYLQSLFHSFRSREITTPFFPRRLERLQQRKVGGKR